jgi:hypothetical protein
MSFLKRLICKTGYVYLVLVLAISNANALAKKDTSFQFPEDAFDAYDSFYICSDTEEGAQRFKTYLEIILPQKNFKFYAPPQNLPSENFTTLVIFRADTTEKQMLNVCPSLSKGAIGFFQNEMRKRLDIMLKQNVFSPNISISANNVSGFSRSSFEIYEKNINKKISYSYNIYSKYADWQMLNLVSYSLFKPNNIDEKNNYNDHVRYISNIYSDFIKSELKHRGLGSFLGGK